MRIDLHLHFHHPVDAGIIHAINELKDIIMTGQTEAAAALNTVADKLDKVALESKGLQEEIAALKVIVEQQSEVSPELQTAIDRVTAKAQAIDDLVPDVPAEPPLA